MSMARVDAKIRSLEEGTLPEYTSQAEQIEARLRKELRRLAALRRFQLQQADARKECAVTSAQNVRDVRAAALWGGHGTRG